MQLINQYSLLVIGVMGLGLLAFLLLRDGIKKQDIIILGIIVLSSILLWYVWHPRQDSLQKAEAVQAQIGQGIPVLIEFQSPY